MKKLYDVDLSGYSTFRLPAMATEFVILETSDDVEGVFAKQKQPLTLTLSPEEREPLLLGGGSNTIFCSDVPLVIYNQIRGFQVINENPDFVDIRIGAGEDWSEIVERIAQMQLWGIERLASIPGTVGAAPVQNIGAYGAELSDICQSVRAYDRVSHEWREFTSKECEFSYRMSHFKQNLSRYCITLVVIRLRRARPYSQYYAGVGEELASRGIVDPSPVDMARVISDIRASKLPNWRDLPNCGSFFVNPVVDRGIVEKLRSQYTDIPVYPVQRVPLPTPARTDDAVHSGRSPYEGGEATHPVTREHTEKFKLSAGWLIEKAGLKGHCIGGICVSDQHALVLVNQNNGTADELHALITKIQDDIQTQFGVHLAPEPNIIVSH